MHHCWLDFIRLEVANWVPVGAWEVLMVSRKGLQEPGWWETWADLLNHWWWHVVRDHCVSVGTGLTGFSWSLPGMEASCKRAGCGGKFGGSQWSR